MTLSEVYDGYDCRAVGQWLLRRSLDSTRFGTNPVIVADKSAAAGFQVKDTLVGLKDILEGKTPTGDGAQAWAKSTITPDMIHPGATAAMIKAADEGVAVDPLILLARDLARTLTDKLHRAQSYAGNRALLDEEKRFELIAAFVNETAQSTGSYMRNQYKDEKSAVDDGSSNAIFGNSALTKGAGSSATFFGKILAKIGGFISGAKAYAFLAFLGVLVDMALMAMIVMTPVLMLAGVVMPSAAMGVLTISVLGTFVLKFVPITVIILNNVGGLVRELIATSSSVDHDTMDALLIMAMSGLYMNIIGLTFFLLFKMGNPEAILGRLQGIDSAAGKLAEEGMNATKYVATAAATAAARPLIGAAAAAWGHFRDPAAEDKSDRMSPGAAQDILDDVNKNKDEKAKWASEIEKRGGRFRMGSTEDGKGIFAMKGKDGNLFTQVEGGPNSVSAAENWLQNMSPEQRNKFYEDQKLEGIGDYSAAPVGFDNDGNAIWAKMGENGQVSFEGGTGAKSPVQAAAEEKQAKEQDAFKAFAEGLNTAVGKDGDLRSKANQTDQINELQSALGRELTKDEHTQVREWMEQPDKRNKFLNDINNVDAKQATVAAATSQVNHITGNATVGAASSAEAKTSAETNNTAAPADATQGGEGSAPAPTPAQSAPQQGEGTPAEPPTVSEQVTKAAAAMNAAMRLDKKYVRNNNDSTANMLTNLKNYRDALPADGAERKQAEKWIDDLQKFDTTGANAANIYGSLGEAKRMMYDRLKGRTDGANKRPGFWTTVASGAYGGWNSGNLLTAIPYVGKIIAEVANERREAPMRARAWAAVGGYSNWKKNKVYAEQAQHFNKAISPALAGEQFAEMMSYNALQGQVNAARTAAAEVVAKTRSQYEQLLEATRNSKGETKGYFSAGDLQGLGRMEAANRFSSIRAEAQLMQGATLKVPVIVDVKDANTGVMTKKVEERAIAITNALAKRLTGDMAVKKFAGGLEDTLVAHYGILEKQFERGSAAWDSTRTMNRDGAAARRFVQEDLSTDYLVAGHMKMVSGKSAFYDLRGQYDSLLQLRNQSNQMLDSYIQEAMKNNPNFMKTVMEGVYKDSAKASTEMAKLDKMPTHLRERAERELMNKWATGKIGKRKLPLDAIFESAYDKGTTTWRLKSDAAIGAQSTEIEILAENNDKIVSKRLVKAGLVGMENAKNVSGKGADYQMKINSVGTELSSFLRKVFENNGVGEEMAYQLSKTTQLAMCDVLESKAFSGRVNNFAAIKNGKGGEKAFTLDPSMFTEIVDVMSQQNMLDRNLAGMLKDTADQLHQHRNANYDGRVATKTVNVKDGSEFQLGMAIKPKKHNN